MTVIEMIQCLVAHLESNPEDRTARLMTSAFTRGFEGELERYQRADGEREVNLE